MRSKSISLLLMAHVLALVAPALASDGVLEINQACAVNTGCFAGDTPGFPVTITGTGGGSYQLTSNLELSNPNTDGIQILTNNVTLDLGGFMIRCRTFSFPTFSPCGLSGPSDGVRVDNNDAAWGAEIRNGSIVGMSTGVYALRPSVVRNLRVSECGGSGIVMISASIISDNMVFNNGSSGISSTPGPDYGTSIVERNLVFSNGGFGLLNAQFVSNVYRDNVFSGNSAGVVGGFPGSLNGGGNVCNGSLTCP
jgi:hypothetical protein